MVDPQPDFRALFQAAPTPCLILTPELRIAAVNDAYLQATMTVREQILQRPLFEVFPDNPEDPAATGTATLRASLQRVLKTGRPDRMAVQRYDIRVPSRHGGCHFEERYWFPLNSPVFDGEGRLTHIVHAVENVTEASIANRRAGELASALLASEKSEAKFREIANVMPQIVWTARPDGAIDWYNNWWYEYTGTVRSPAIPSWNTVMHPDDLAAAVEGWSACLASGRPYQMEYRFRRRSDGQYRWHLGRAIAVRDEHGRTVRWIGSNTDIHDQKRIERELKEERQLRERLTNTLAHDLRTPLSTASMAAQILLRSRENESQREQLLKRAVASLERVDEMIKDMLDASVLRSGQTLAVSMAECDLHLLAHHVVADLAVVHGQRVALRAQEALLGFWSSDGLRRVIENLVVNALKYGSPDTAVTVTLTRTGEGARLAVHNYGRPLSEVEKSSLFQLFHRTPSAETGSAQGWGIGLAVVKGIVDAHHGRIGLESSALAGTTFTVDLPIDARAGD